MLNSTLVAIPFII